MSLHGPVVRRAVIFGGPFLAYIAALVHPKGLAPGERQFLVFHLAFPLLVCLLAWTLLLLLNGLDDTAATVARVLVIPFAVAYTTFVTFDGIAMGAFAWKVTELPREAWPAGVELVNTVSSSELERPLYLAAGLSWVAAVIGVAVALRRTAPWPALLLLVIGAALFAKSHVRPWGAAGMAAFLAGVVWLELRPARDVRSADPGQLSVDARRRT
jgi:hypothetical protein